MVKRHAHLVLVAAAFASAVLPGSAQTRATVTVADYERAEKFLNYNTNPLVSNGAVRANWLPDDRFWYRNQTAARGTSSYSSTRPGPPGRRRSTTRASPRR